MNFRTLTAADFSRLYAELRETEQVLLRTAAIHCGLHPILGRLATVHDGEKIGLVLRDEPLDQAALPGRRSCPMIKGGPALASISAFANALDGYLDPR